MSGPAGFEWRRHTRLIVLVVLALAAWFARDRWVDGGVAAAAVPRASTRPARTGVAAPPRSVAAGPGADDVCTAPPAMPQRSAWQLAVADPFAAPRAPAPRVVPAVVAPVPVAAAPVAPAAPRLPYRFLGHFDEPGQPPTVFLGLGEQLIHARAGDTLDGGFRLETIGRRELGFVHVQQNVSVRLPIDGEPS